METATTVWRHSNNNQCMSSFVQMLNPEAVQDLAQVGEGFFWMMLAVLEMSLTLLSAEVLELVFTTVDTLKMQVLCVQVQYFYATDSEINYSYTTQPQWLPSSSFLHKTIIHSCRTKQSTLVECLVQVELYF